MKEINYKIETLLENLKTSEDKQRAEIINKLSEDYNNTIPLLWSKALAKDNLRSILSVIRDIIKKEKPRGIFIRTIGKSKTKLSAFLQDSDPKVRKNACGIIGETSDSEYLEALYIAYNLEEQLFVRPSYVLSIGNCGSADDAGKLQLILEDLITNAKTAGDKSLLIKNEKHINEEKLVLSRVIAKLSPPAHHKFKGFEAPVPIVLTSMNDQFQVTLKELAEKSIRGKLVNEGILIEEKNLDKIYTCRTFYEPLYPLLNCKNLQFDYKVIATAILKSNIVSFLRNCHEEASICNTPFWYRVEFKTMEDNKERTEFVKNLSRQLDEISSGNLKNSTSSYEVEIRIIEKKNLCSVFIKFYSYSDNRFDYREKDLPASLNPVTAAIVIKSIEKWLKPNARVIDPFCGTATMLIERAKVKKFSSLTGVDIFKSAITAATINSNLANLKMELIAKDILEYSPLDIFDEMITNMPFESRAYVHNYNIDLYSGFVNKISQIVKPGGMVFLYTVEKNLLKDNLIVNKQLELIDEIKFESGNLTPHMFVLKVR